MLEMSRISFFNRMARPRLADGVYWLGHPAGEVPLFRPRRPARAHQAWHNTVDLLACFGEEYCQVADVVEPGPCGWGNQMRQGGLAVVREAFCFGIIGAGSDLAGQFTFSQPHGPG
jgi:hypothetical protein